MHNRERKMCQFVSFNKVTNTKLDFAIEKKLKEFVSNCGSPWAPQKGGVCLTK
jgi:ribosomal protein S18